MKQNRNEEYCSYLSCLWLLLPSEAQVLFLNLYKRISLAIWFALTYCEISRAASLSLP